MVKQLLTDMLPGSWMLTGRACSVPIVAAQPGLVATPIWPAATSSC